jgi:Gpi18-like mannosyltransferase
MTEKLTKKLSWLNMNAIAIALIAKALILFFGAMAFQTVTDQPLDANNSFLGIWSRWDAAHYLKLAENGYTAVGDDRFLIVFFPLYPALVAVFEIVLRDYLISAFFVSAVTSVALALAFRALVNLDHSEKTAQLAVLFLFIFPTSYFLHIPYTESLFLASTVGCFLAARKRFWLAAAALGAAACLTRVNGLILVPALAFEVWEEYKETRCFNKMWLWLLLIPAGFGLYLVLNYVVAGEPLMFMTYQREHWFRYFRFPWEGIWETAKRINNPKPSDAQMTGIQEILFVAVGFAATVIGWRHLRNSYRAWMAANWLLFVSTSFVLSVPRYTLTLFPLFILMALAARRYRPLKVLFAVWSVLFLALFSVQFVRGWWAF